MEPSPSIDACRPRVSSTTESPVDWKRQAEFTSRMLVTLDGLWFTNAVEALGLEKGFELDVRVFVGQFKIATRTWRHSAGLDGKSREDKASVFQAMAHLYGHRFEILQEDDHVTMRLHECAFYENLKRAGRTDSHDCRMLCRKLAPEWFAEIEPRTGGKGDVDLQLPTGGPHCDWSVAHPKEDEDRAENSDDARVSNETV